MKKFILILFGLLISPLSFVSAQLSDDILDGILGGFEYNFGYDNEEITVENITSTSVTIESPVVSDGVGDDIVDYTLMYGEVPFESIVDGTDFTLFDTLKDKEFSSVTPTNGVVRFTLNSSDGITSTEVYYVTVVPFDSDGNMGQVSVTEICFQLSTQTYGEGEECEDGEGTEHDAAGDDSDGHNSSVNMSLANISYQIQGNNIRLTWTTLDGVDEVEIYLRNTNGTTYTKLATVDMSTEKYVFNPNRKSPLYVRVIGLNSNGEQVGNEVIQAINDYKVSGSSSNPDPDPTIPSVPTVGPEDNLLWIVLLTVFVFLSIGMWRRTQKN